MQNQKEHFENNFIYDLIIKIKRTLLELDFHMKYKAIVFLNIFR